MRRYSLLLFSSACAFSGAVLLLARENPDLPVVPHVDVARYAGKMVRNRAAAVVGTPNRKYLWILSRAPHLPKATYDDLLARVKVLGFEIARLQKTAQDG